MASALETYGMMGDTRTAALVSGDGSIDWLCVPRFDGMPVFGALVDPVHGGRWSITPIRSSVAQRDYTEGAASIRTTWRGPAGVVETWEGLLSDASTRLLPRMTVVRRVMCTSGTAEIDVLFDPRLGLPGRAPARVRYERSALVCEWGSTALGLTHDGGAAVRPGEMLRLPLAAGRSVTFVLGLGYREPLVFVPLARALDLLADDDRWWRSWLRRFDVPDTHASTIARSIITLRLLTYAPSGAPVAAPTTSLPAPPGSGETWDYRFSWPRDASIGVEAFLTFGSRDEPRAFLEWFVTASRITRPRLDVVYSLDGRSLPEERELEDVAGYEGGQPVRLGNAASTQHQLDVYGWVLEAAWKMHEAGERLNAPHWRALRAFADRIVQEWRRPDSGIWEERGDPQQHVFPKLMAWSGLDRAIRLAETYPSRGRDEPWRRARDALAEEIRHRGYSERLGSYRRIYDRDEVDASLLRLAALGFDDDGERVRGTVDAIRRRLGAGGALLYRYARDDMREGAFVPCSFWLVEALARTGRLDEAEEAFDELCALATPLDLYAEQIDPSSRAPMGNFPQAFSHATLLQAAAALNEGRETSRGSSRRSRGQRSSPRVSAPRS